MADIAVDWSTTADESRLTSWTLTDPGDGTAFELTEVDTVDRTAVFESTASGASLVSNRREWETIQEAGTFNGGHILALLGPQSWVGVSPDGTIQPQHGVGLRAQQSGGRNVGIIAWQNIFAGFYWTINVGVWGSATDGSDFLNRQYNLALDSLIDNTSITAYERTSNVVTITAAGHSCRVGDYIGVDMADNALDMAAIVESVDGDQVTYTHAGADDADGGTGTLRRIFPFWLEMRMASDDADETVVQVRAWREFSLPPDWVDIDLDAGIDLPGASGDYVSAADNASFDLTGDCEIIVDVTMADWTPAADSILIGKYLTTGSQRSYALRIKTSGAVEFLWAATGVIANGALSTANLSSMGANTRTCIRMTHDNDNGVGSQATTRFYTGPTIDGPWTQLGSDVNTNWAGGASGIFNGTAAIEVGSFNGGSNRVTGRIHNWRMFDASGTNVSEFIGTKILDGTDTTFGDSSNGLTWTLNGNTVVSNDGVVGGSTAGALAADASLAGTPAARADTPHPTGAGYPFIVVAHVGLSDYSRATYGKVLADSTWDSEFDIGWSEETQADQSMSAAGLVVHEGSLTEAQDAQTSSATGLVIHEGSLTETQADQTSTASGHIEHAGSLTETQDAQTSSATGHIEHAGSVAEAQDAQTSSATGLIIHEGSLTETQADQTSTASGTVTPPEVTGTLTETQDAQTSSAAGHIEHAGSLTETQADQTSTAAGWAEATGTLSEVQADQTCEALGTVGDVTFGILAEMQDAQTSSAAGHIEHVGSVTETQDAQTSSAAGHIEHAGSLTETQADQSSTASGQLGLEGSLAETQADQAMSAAGQTGDGGSMNVTQAADSMAATGAVGQPGTINETQDAQTSSATGWVEATGTLSKVQASQTGSGAGHLSAVGQGAFTRAADSMSAAGAVDAVGSMAVTEANDTISIVAYLGQFESPAARTLVVRAESRTLAVPVDRRTLVVGGANVEVVKDPDAELDYVFDFTDWLPGADTIATSTVTIDGDAVLGTKSATSTAITQWVSGGTVDTLQRITCEITTTQGRTDQRTIFMRIKDR